MNVFIDVKKVHGIIIYTSLKIEAIDYFFTAITDLALLVYLYVLYS